jgi:hypothetical protein
VFLGTVEKVDTCVVCITAEADPIGCLSEASKSDRWYIYTLILKRPLYVLWYMYGKSVNGSEWEWMGMDGNG